MYIRIYIYIKYIYICICIHICIHTHIYIYVSYIYLYHTEQCTGFIRDLGARQKKSRLREWKWYGTAGPLVARYCCRLAPAEPVPWRGAHWMAMLFTIESLRQSFLIHTVAGGFNFQSHLFLCFFFSTWDEDNNWHIYIYIYVFVVWLKPPIGGLPAKSTARGDLAGERQ